MKTTRFASLAALISFALTAAASHASDAAMAKLPAEANASVVRNTR